MKDISSIRGVIPAMITCFDQKGRYDEARQRDLTEFLIGKGVNALYLTGSTGEAPDAESAAGSSAGDSLSAGPGAAADLSGAAGAPAVTPASPDSQDTASGLGLTGSGSRSA